ncbi:MAG TPA: tryptophan 2,3-dioxygenase family protein [Phycisphaerales bacterium]|nr:tryptophan 2,3-dioxygenase family protein [Phycisphaerales bacterium]
MTMGDPERPGKLTYGSYLFVPDLLELQRSQSQHHDEMLFIISHQVYELWFKQSLHELEVVCRHLDADAPLKAARVFDRLHRIVHLLIEQIPLLETMSTLDFAEFRDHLRPASGFQSVQFRLIEFMCGAKNPRLMSLAGDDARARADLGRFLARPTIYDHLLHHLHRAGFAMPRSVLERDTSQPHQVDEAVVAALVRLYRDADAHYPQFRLCEQFIEFDERVAIWRFHHVKMVERMIGSKTGTGGSAGAKYHAGTLSIRFFPDLWVVRDHVGGAYGGGEHPAPAG